MRKIIFITKVLFVIALSVSITSYAASETGNSNTATKKDPQTQTSQPTLPVTNSNSTTSQQTKADEKNSFYNQPNSFDILCNNCFNWIALVP